MNTNLTLSERINQKWQGFGAATQFIIKAVTAVIFWRLLYTFVLAPLRFPDSILTKLIGKGTILIINIISSHNIPKAYCTDSRLGGEVLLFRNNHCILRIGDACNGLELMLIYAGVIALLPGKSITKFWYIFLGIMALMVTNMVRCAGLEWVYEFYRPFFETTHHYLFTLVMYVLIFTGWVLYINKQKEDAKG